MRATDIHTREEEGGTTLQLPLIHRLTNTDRHAASDLGLVASRRLGLCSAVDRQREVDQYRRPHARQRREKEQNPPRVIDGRDEPAKPPAAPSFRGVNEEDRRAGSAVTHGPLLLQLRWHNFDDKFSGQILLLLQLITTLHFHPIRTLA